MAGREPVRHLEMLRAVSSCQGQSPLPGFAAAHTQAPTGTQGWHTRAHNLLRVWESELRNRGIPEPSQHPREPLPSSSPRIAFSSLDPELFWDLSRIYRGL